MAAHALRSAIKSICATNPTPQSTPSVHLHCANRVHQSDARVLTVMGPEAGLDMFGEFFERITPSFDGRYDYPQDGNCVLFWTNSPPSAPPPNLHRDHNHASDTQQAAPHTVHIIGGKGGHGLYPGQARKTNVRRRGVNGRVVLIRVTKLLINFV